MTWIVFDPILACLTNKDHHCYFHLEDRMEDLEIVRESPTFGCIPSCSRRLLALSMAQLRNPSCIHMSCKLGLILIGEEIPIFGCIPSWCHRLLALSMAQLRNPSCIHKKCMLGLILIGEGLLSIGCSSIFLRTPSLSCHPLERFWTQLRSPFCIHMRCMLE